MYFLNISLSALFARQAGVSLRLRRRASQPSPAKPISVIAQVGGLGDRAAAERERRVEGRESVAVYDVLVYAQPVWLKKCIAGPALQVCEPHGERYPGRGVDRPRRRQPKEIANEQLDLGHEEVVVGGEDERRRKGHVELHLKEDPRSA